MEQKILFIKMWESGNYTKRALCNHFGISRPTGDKLIKSYKEEGESCLSGSSTAPHSTPHKTPPKIEEAIVKLRKKHPNWGALKFKVLLEKQFERN